MPRHTFLSLLLLLTSSGTLNAQPLAPPPAHPQAAAKPSVVVGGYAEAFYQWNLNRPSNGITNFRGFDNRHNSFTLSNVALDLNWDQDDLIGRVTLQVGHTPSTYYLSEPVSAGASGANASDAELWKYVQQAYVGYRFSPALTLAAGLFLSPIGPETMAVRDNWNWSRSNLFFGLPFYHTGARLTYAVAADWAVTVAAYNGWNSVVDNNEHKSLSTQLAYTRPKVIASLLYFGGIERVAGLPEGRGWRHLFDSHVTWHATARLSLLAHGNAGFERTKFGRSSWTAGALYARFHALGPLFVVVRGDAFYQHAAKDQRGAEPPLFWPFAWVSSGTLTLDLRAHERASFRLEYRHDQAAGNMYFGSNVMGDGTTTAFVANRSSQDTVTAGVTTWF